MYRTAEPILRWHKANEQYLVNRRPIANVGIVWSQRNTDFYGRDNPEELVEQPWRGFTQALVRARIPYLPVHVDHIEREGSNLAVLILPNVAALSDEQVAAVRRFRRAGRGADRDRPDQSLQRVGRPSSRFCPGRSLRRHGRQACRGHLARDRGQTGPQPFFALRSAAHSHETDQRNPAHVPASDAGASRPRLRPEGG